MEQDKGGNHSSQILDVGALQEMLNSLALNDQCNLSEVTTTTTINVNVCSHEVTSRHMDDNGAAATITDTSMSDTSEGKQMLGSAQKSLAETIHANVFYPRGYNPCTHSYTNPPQLSCLSSLNNNCSDSLTEATQNHRPQQAVDSLRNSCGDNTYRPRELEQQSGTCELYQCSAGGDNLLNEQSADTSVDIIVVPDEIPQKFNVAQAFTATRTSVAVGRPHYQQMCPPKHSTTIHAEQEVHALKHVFTRNAEINFPSRGPMFSGRTEAGGNMYRGAASGAGETSKKPTLSKHTVLHATAPPFYPRFALPSPSERPRRTAQSVYLPLPPHAYLPISAADYQDAESPIIFGYSQKMRQRKELRLSSRFPMQGVRHYHHNFYIKDINLN